MASKSQKNFFLKYGNTTIDIIVKKNKLSRNFKFTFDKKNLIGLVSMKDLHLLEKMLNGYTNNLVHSLL